MGCAIQYLQRPEAEALEKVEKADVLKVLINVKLSHCGNDLIASEMNPWPKRSRSAGKEEIAHKLQ
jgi:hypothetical protein